MTSAYELIDQKKAMIFQLEKEICDLYESCRWLSEEKPTYPSRELRAKLTWTLDQANLRIAIVTKTGILQVKSVENGVVSKRVKICSCNPCSNREKGIPMWVNKKAFFESESDWRDSLPPGGTITLTDPPISDRKLTKLMSKPLTASTDPLRLYELQGRFPGATIVISTTKGDFDIEYAYVPPDTEDDWTSYWQHGIYHSASNSTVYSFKDVYPGEKIDLVVIWRGFYIDVSHLIPL